MLHYHKVFLLKAAHKVGGCSGAVRDLGLVPPDRVIIPANKIEVFCKVIVIYSCVEAHHIVSNEVLRADFSDDFDLVGLKLDVKV